MSTTLKLLSSIILLLMLLLLTGCLEHREEIVVHSDGSVDITAKIEGDIEDFKAGVAIPDSSEWIINKLQYDTTKRAVKLKMEAYREIPYGKPLPATFAVKGSDPDSLQLYFPTEIKMWKDGSRTFYEFKRIYHARRFQRYHGNEDMQIDPELENRVMENGIFNVSEKDRQQYTDQMLLQFGMQHFYQFEDMLNQLVIQNKLTAAVKDSTLLAVEEYFDSTLTNELILSILKLDDDDIEQAYTRLMQKTRDDFTSIYSAISGDNNTGEGSAYRTAYNRILQETTITEKLGGHTYIIIIGLPGSIVNTNGFTDISSPGEVMWEFKGTDLHDRQVVLHAVSIVE